MIVTQLAQCRAESIRWDKIYAFSVNGIDQNARNLIARYIMSKYFLFNETHYGLTIIFARFAFQDGAIRIGEWNVRHAWHERVEPTMIMRLACSERDRTHRPPVKPTEETNEVMSFGVELRQFDCCLNGFRSGICQKSFCALFK